MFYRYFSPMSNLSPLNSPNLPKGIDQNNRNYILNLIENVFSIYSDFHSLRPVF